MMFEIIIFLILCLIGYIATLASHFAAQVRVGLIPGILNLTFLEAFFSGFFPAWAWHKNPLGMFWVIFLLAPILLIIRLATKEDS